MSSTIKSDVDLSPEGKRALLARLLQEKASSSPTRKSLTRIQPIPRDTGTELPLSFGQQRLWFLDQLEPGSPVYNVPAAIRLTGPINVAALEQSLGEILRRHEVLRTTFSTVDGRPVQVISPAMPSTLSVVDLRDLSETERKVQTLRLATKEAQQPFNLTRGPLLRVTLIRLGEEEHMLLLVMHHINSDGWSIGLLFRELEAFYISFTTGTSVSLPPLPIQYADFAHWQRQWLQGKVLEQQLSYWKQQLGGNLPVLELPTDRPRPAVQSYRGARQSLVLPKTLTEALKALSRQEEVTLFMTLFAAFKTLLYRYTNQDDIIVGFPIANRTRAEIERLIGYFANTLVLRTDLSGNPTFRELLGRVKELALGAYAHQDLPFEKLVEETQPERSLSHNPLFQVLFALHNAPMQTLELSGLTLSPNPDSPPWHLEIDKGIARFDLALDLWERPQGLSGLIEYSTDLFDGATITRMQGHFQTLLEGIAANPEQRVAELPLLTELERHQLLVEWNGKTSEYQKDKCIHELFEAQVARAPEAIAVVCDGEQLTYSELSRRANQVAHYLRRRGVGPEVLVGIFMDRSVEMMVGLLAILKAGGAYVPLDPAYPRERLSFMLADAEVTVLLTQKRLAKNLPESDAKVVCLDADWQQIARESEENPVSDATAENLAYVIYTSGSTGRPKGVQVNHHSVIHLFEATRPMFGFDEHDVWTVFHSYAFDFSVWEIWGPILYGGRLVVVPLRVTQSPTEFYNLLRRERVTVLNQTPSAMRQLMQAQREAAEAVRDLSLRLIICGGEAFPREVASELLEWGIPIWNFYGPTEATVWTTIHRVESTESKEGVIPIGRPIADLQVYILDSHLQLVPVGVPGELHIGGDGLARGYLKRPELTAEKFIRNPFSHEPGARLYKTGDLARYLPDGNIEFLGRIDHQVKVRGFRIELGEIEAVLGQHPAVRETVVMAREDEPGNKRLVAYVVANQEQASSVSKLSLLKEKLQGYKVPEHLVAYGVINQKQVPSVSEMRSFLKEKLPEYMVPSAFVILEALPLTPGGKVDRRALPMPDHIRPELERAFVAPRDTLELQLTKVWEKVLGTQPIGVRDNFFDLGGHSLLALSLFAQIEKVLGKNLPLATLFQAPTVEQLAGILRQQGWSPSWSSLVPIQPSGSKPPFFCVHAGGGIVLFYRDLARRLGPDQPFYGLQARRLNGKYAPHTRVEDMAAYYIKEIRRVQPEGPYFLGGSSMGGTVAFEMAQQLRAHGQNVALVAMFDTLCPGHFKFLRSTTSFHYRLSFLKLRMKHHLGSLSMFDSKDKLTYIRQKAKKAKRMIRRSIKERNKAIARKFYLMAGHPLPQALQETQDTLALAARSYIPQVYPGKVTLFRASTPLPGAPPDRTNGWGGFVAGELEIHDVPGTHGAIVVEPRVRALADKLRECIDKAVVNELDSGMELTRKGPQYSKFDNPIHAQQAQI